MKFWILAIIALIVQETFTTNVVIIQAYQNHHSIFFFSIIFLFAMCFDISFGYFTGKYLRTKQKNNKFVLWAENYVKKFDRFIGRFGEKLFIFFISLLLPPYVPAFIASWLGLSSRSLLIFIVVADIIWYIFSWSVVLGITHWIEDTRYALIVILGISLLITLIQKKVAQKITKK